MRSIKAKHPTQRDDIADLVTHRAMPTSSIDHLDPFLFLNHHGPQIYPRANRGLPFGPHPHRGFETVTFILKGDLAHHDSGGHSSVIQAGGVQWMTAGRGLVHSEISSEDFKINGGPLEILQLWLNLPARLKMTQPKYVGLQKNEIPFIETDEGRVRLQLLAGTWREKSQQKLGAFQPHIDIQLMTLYFHENGKLSLRVPKSHNIFCYIVSGKMKVNGEEVSAFHLIEFSHDDEQIELSAVTTTGEDSVVIFGHAEPFHEPIIAHGPFVMNSREEILQAIADYQAGKFN